MKPLMVTCPVCKGHKTASGRSAMGYPATLPCKRCDAMGEVLLDSLTEEEKNPPKPVIYERDDI